MTECSAKTIGDRPLRLNNGVAEPPLPNLTATTMHRNTHLTLEQRHHDDLVWNYLPVSLPSDQCALGRDFQAYIMPLVRPNWRADLVKYRVFEEGVTNKLVGFFQDGETDETMVLVRVNGEGREFVVDGKNEILVMLTLHRAGLSPPLYLVTMNAMCYGYIPGRTLTSDEMQREDVLEATANALARFHSVPIPNALQTSTPCVWNQVDNWMKQITDELSDDSTTQRFKQVFGSLEELKKELLWLKSFLGAPITKKGNVGVYVSDCGLLNGFDKPRQQACDSHCVLCHNDAQPLNFVRTPHGEVVLIDMEYSGINYPAFDIGCFFCEFAGVHGTVDYSRYPSEVVQKKWITYYLEECARLKGVDKKTITPYLVHGLYKDANQFALVAHFMWTLWSLIQYKHSTIHFDYLQYGCARYAEYKARKIVILSLK